ncbi:MAG: BatA domain-containing protein [Planctomycetota bacterium]|nr:BatA domain-containing protein [Planctomycetota bacterium]
MELSLLSSAMLWGATAAAVPFVVHLLVSRPPKRVIFPTMRFLSGSARKVASGMKLKRLLLLLARAALPALIALIMARAMFVPSVSASQDLPAIGILIDNSSSMLVKTARSTVLDNALKRAKSVVDSAPNGAIFCIASLDSARDFVRDPNVAKKLIDEAAASSSSASVMDALERLVEQYFARISEERLRKIVIVSDFAAHNFETGKVPELNGIGLSLIDVGTEISQDRAVVEAEPVSSVILPGVPAAVAFTARSNYDLDAQTVQLIVNGRNVATRTFDLKAGQPVRLTMEFTLDESLQGSIAGEVSYLANDAFPLNDSAYFAFDLATSLKVLILHGESEQQRKLARILSNAISPSLLGNASPYEVVTASATSFKIAALSSFDAVYYISEEPPNQLGRNMLGDWTRGGGVLFVFTTPAMDREVFGELLGLEQVASAPAYLDEPLALSSISPRNSLVDFFSEGSNGRLDFVLSMARQDIGRVPENARVLFEYEDGVPAALVLPREQGLTVLFNISLDRSESNLIARPVFLPLVHEVLKFTSPLASLKRSFLYGIDEVRLRVPQSAESAVIVQEDGPDISMELDRTNRLAFARSLEPGAYRVALGAQEIPSRAFALNYPAHEMILDPMSEDELKTLFPEAEFENRTKTSSIFSFGSFDLNNLLIPLLFALFLFELWLSNTFYKAAPANLAADEKDLEE